MFSSFVCRLLILITAYATNTYAVQPYVVSIQDNNGVPRCLGALVTPNMVATSAGCVSFNGISNFGVAVNNGAQVVNLIALTYHKKYDRNTNAYDVAVLKLARDVNNGTIALASNSPKTGTAGVVTGWDANKRLVDMSVSVINREYCVSGKYIYGKNEVLNSMFCGLTTDNKACGILPGSPLVANNQLVGLISWGNVCDNNGNPDIYTDITYVRAWITDIVKKLVVL